MDKQNEILPWYPKYLHIKDSELKLNKTFIIYPYIDPDKDENLQKLANRHNKVFHRVEHYYSCNDDLVISLFFDGYRYFRIDDEDERRFVKTYESDPKHFLDDNNYGKNPVVRMLYEQAFEDLKNVFPGTIEYNIEETLDGFYHTEKLVKHVNKWARWGDASQKLDYFPKYIDICNHDIPNIFVLSEIIDEKTAQYWKCSGEWGMILNYSDKSYRIIRQSSDYCSTDENMITIKEATALEFLESNPMFCLDSTKKYYTEAWDEIKKENPHAGNMWFESSHDFQYVSYNFNNKVKNWAL